MASASAADIAKLETKAVAAEKLIELLRQQIAQVRTRRRRWRWRDFRITV